jgi:cell division protein FtsZ
VIATGFGKIEEKSASRFKKVAPISFSMRENKDVPTFMRKVKVNERFDELKLKEPPGFSVEDEDRFDIPTFLRKQAD